MTRWLPTIAVLALFVILAPAPSWSQLLVISSDRGSPPGAPPESLDPLVDPNTVLVFADAATPDVRLNLMAINFEGSISLQAVCCEDARTGAAAPGAAQAVSFDVSPQTIEFQRPVGLPPYIPVSMPATLRLTGQGLTESHRGTFRVKFKAYALRPSATPFAAGEVIFSIVPPMLPDGTAVPCLTPSDNPPVAAPLASVAMGQFKNKNTMPETTQYAIAMRSAKSTGYGWQINISKFPIPGPFGLTFGLPPDMALIILTNSSHSPKWLYPVDVAGCTPRVPRVVAQRTGDVSAILIAKTTTKTVVLGSAVDNDLDFFAEPNFWTLFGGRTVTIDSIAASQ